MKIFDLEITHALEFFCQDTDSIDIDAEESYILKPWYKYMSDRYIPVDDEDGMPQKLLDVSKLNELNFQPKISLNEGIKEMILIYKNLKNKTQT